MSEFEYYDFLSEQPLSAAAQKELREVSGHAHLTRHRLTVTYSYGGSFRGKPPELVARHFDGAVHAANWGSRQVLLRVPGSALPMRDLEPYLADGALEAHEREDWLIVDASVEPEDGGGEWVDEAQAETWLPSLLPLRTELAAGDLRACYVAWLAGIQNGLLEDDTLEPPVPAGLADPSPALAALVSFLGVSPDLLAVAAERSAARPSAPSAIDLARAIAAMPAEEYQRLLLQVALGQASSVQATLVRAATTRTTPRPGQRTIEALLAATEERQRAQAAERRARRLAREP